MINVSNDFKERMKEHRDFKNYAEITFADGSEMTLDASQFSASNNNLVDGASDSSFPLGVAVSKSAQIELINDEQQYADKDFLGAKIRLYIEFQTDDEGTVERIEKGTYTVITPETYGETVIITAYDDMYKADKDYTTKLTFPQSAGAVLRDICETCDISLGSSTFLHDDFIIQNKPTGKFREVIGQIAMIACGNARIDRQNRLQIVSYDFSGWETEGEYHLLNEFTAPKIEYNDTTITGFKTIIKGETSEDDTEILQGTDTYCITVENPLISGKEDTVLSWLLERIGNVPFRPFSGDAISNPLVEFMDLAKVQDRRGNQYNTFVTDVNFLMPGYTTLKNSTPSATRSAIAYTSNSARVEQRARQLVELEKNARELAVERLSEALANGSGLYETDEIQPDKSTIRYLHDKPALAESKTIIKLTSEGIGISADGGKTYPWGITFTGQAILDLIYAVGIDCDYLTTGAITVKDNSGNIIFQVDMDTKSVTISGDHVRIGGKSATTALADNLTEAKNYSDGKLSDYANTVSKSLSGLQEQIDGQIETFYYDYEPSMQNIPASQWTTEAERQKHQGDLFYNKKTGYAYRFFKDGSTWKWQLIQDTDITKAMQTAETAKDTADNKRRVFVVTPEPPYDIGDLWTNGTDVLTCAVARAQGAAYVSTDWQKLNKYTDDTVANQALDEARKSTNLTIILDNEYQGIPTDSTGKYSGTLSVSTIVQTYYGHQNVSASCTYTFQKSDGVTYTWDGATRKCTITALTTDTGWVDITASYMSLFTVTKRFNVAKVRAGAVGATGTQGINLFGFNKNISIWGGTGSFDKSINGVQIKTTKPAGAFRLQHLGFNGISGWYTVSGEIYATTSLIVNIDVCDAERKKFSVTTTPQKFLVQANVTNYYGQSGETYNGFVDFEGTLPSGETIYIKNLKVEVGLVDNPVWTPAPQDLVGPTGPQGATGAQGPKGDKGATGDKGAKGDTGAAGRTYFMEPSTLIVKRSANNAMAPNYITLSAYYRDGTATARTAYAGRFKIEESLDGDKWTTVYTSTANETTVTHSLYGALATSAGGAISSASNKTIGIPRDVVAIRCTLYAAGGTTQMLDMQTVAVVVDVDELTHDEIFNLLTNNGEIKGIYKEGNQLYISFTYAKGGELVLGGKNNGNGKLRIQDENGNDIITGGNEGIDTRVPGYGGISMKNGELQMYEYVNYAYPETAILKTEYFNYHHAVTLRLKSRCGFTVINDRTGHFVFDIYDDGTEWGVTYFNSDISANNLNLFGNFHTNGDLYVAGEKDRIVNTKDYGMRKQYAYETASPMFGDVGEGFTDENGECYVYLDDVFAETVSAQVEYQVFLQKEGDGDVWVDLKDPAFFVVKGTPGLKFAWEIKAKQENYECDYLESYVKERDDDSDWAVYEQQYIKEIENLISEQEEILYETT